MTRQNSKFHAGTLGIALALLGLAACTQPAPEPTPVPVPSPVPTQPVLPDPEPTGQVVQEIPTPTYDNWMDAPATPGNWFYAAETGETLALFGPSRTEPVLVLRCDLATRRVGVGRVGTATGQVQMRIRAETADRTITASPLAGGPDMIIHEFAASDNFLDAIAFSRGRFAVEVAGQPTLYLPAWPEVTRVIEDCR